MQVHAMVDISNASFHGLLQGAALVGILHVQPTHLFQLSDGENRLHLSTNSSASFTRINKDARVGAMARSYQWYQARIKWSRNIVTNIVRNLLGHGNQCETGESACCVCYTAACDHASNKPVAVAGSPSHLR